ncbi:hypothetical protein O181_017321 [Austropuccinia psidii MF-1]|uniref:Uncharacterized protein n=1 Tax=Austropuccinia psidii MF-1 TaxID=1389203 RepID=A0A9Q3C7D2_9BASI|nr:hypothetical protein [Austropuccinia psidii MF-1]
MFIGLHASLQKCGLSYNHTDAGPVMCQNAGGKRYGCPVEDCRTPQGELKKTLYFRNCREQRTGSTINYVWPTEFLCDNIKNTLFVSSGKKSSGLNTPKISMKGNIQCWWKHWNDQNAVRPSCQKCEIYITYKN